MLTTPVEACNVWPKHAELQGGGEISQNWLRSGGIGAEKEDHKTAVMTEAHGNEGHPVIQEAGMYTRK